MASVSQQMKLRSSLRDTRENEARDMLQKRVTLSSRRRSGGDAQEERRFKTYWVPCQLDWPTKPDG